MTTQPSKTLNFDAEVIEVLESLEVRPGDGRFVGVLNCGQLERKLYERTNKALEALGGKWNRRAGGHVFKIDPREQLAGLLGNGSLVVVRDGFFETPRHVVDRMLGLAPHDGGFVLEPSAGLGAIADVLVERGIPQESIYCVELNPDRADALRSTGYQVYSADFLQMQFTMMKFNRIYMNPPFENGQDIDHVMHAYEFLAGAGALVSVMSEGPFFRSDKKAVAFREWIEGHGGHSFKLPDGAFRESGSGVKTRLVVVNT